MKKTGVINKEIAEVIASMGHGDMLVVSDAGLAIPNNIRRIDVSIRPGSPEVLDLVRVIQEELQVESILVPEQMNQYCLHILDELKKIFPDLKIQEVATDVYIEHAYQSKAIIRTGECTTFANVILVAGVTF